MGASCTKAGREEAAFLKASKEGDCHVVQQAITRDVKWAFKVQTWNGQSVFHLAARYGRMDVLETAVEAVRFNPAGPEKWSKLLRMGHSTDALLRAFCNLQDARCQTPLHLACIYGHADLAQRLLELGSTPWAWDELGGRTPLHYAASMGHVDVIRVVVSHNDLPPTGEALRRPNTSRTRLVDICNDSGYTPLHYAVWAGNTASIRALTSYDASLSSRNVGCGSDWVVSCLKCTPLHLAAHKGNEAVVKLLLSAYVQSQPPQGADAPPITDRRRRDPRRHVNANRQLPYHMAVARNHTRLAEMLHPDVPFSFILTPAEMESRLYGVAKLAVLAAKVLQAKLLCDIDDAVSALAAAAPRGTAAAGRTRSGSAAALSGAVAAAPTAQQVLAAATARLRAAGERSLGGAASLAAALDGAVGASPISGLQAGDGVAPPGRRPQSQQQQQQPQQQSRKQSFEQARGGGAMGVSRLSYDSVASAPPVVTGVAATAAAAAAAKVSPPGSGGSSATSGGDSEREALAVEPVQDFTGRPRPVDSAVPNTDAPADTQAQPLPLPPAPLSPFLPAAASNLSGGGASAAAAAGARPPPTFSDAASAFALFAAEPFEEQPAAAAGALQNAGSSSISLAALAHNRTQQAAAAAATPQPPSSTSVGIAALARGRTRGGAGGAAGGAGTGAGGAPGGANGKNQPGRSRSLRRLLTGGRPRRSNTQGSMIAGSRGDVSVGGGNAAADAPAPWSDGEDGDDLDDILYAMRPGEMPESEPAAAGTAAAAAAAAAAVGAASGEDASAGPAAAVSLPQPAAPARRGGGGLTFWRRPTSQALQQQQQPTPDSGSPRAGSVRAGLAAGAALAAAPTGSSRGPAPMPLGASGTPSPAPSGGLANTLPPGVVEARTSVEAPASPHPHMAAVEDSLAAAAAEVPPGAINRAEWGNVDGPRRSSISVAVLARGGVPSTLAPAASVAAAGAAEMADGADAAGGEPVVDSAMLAMLASLVEAPQHVLRRYRLLQLTHGLDLQDLLRDHSEKAAATAAGGPGTGAAGGSDGVLPEGASGGLAVAGSEAEASASGAGRSAGVATASAASPAMRAASAALDDLLRPGLGAAADAEAVVTASGGGGGVAASPRPALSPFAIAQADAAAACATAATSVSASPGVGLPRLPTGMARQPSGAGPSPSLAAAAGGVGGHANTNGNANATSANLAGHLLRTLSSQAASESGEGMCGVCFDQPDVLRITGCGHRLCADCSRELCKLNTFKPALCPFCRGFIGGFKFVGR